VANTIFLSRSDRVSVVMIMTTLRESLSLANAIVEMARFSPSPSKLAGPFRLLLHIIVTGRNTFESNGFGFCSRSCGEHKCH